MERTPHPGQIMEKIPEKPRGSLVGGLKRGLLAEAAALDPIPQDR
jgi:hypothetical protein